MKYFAFLFSLLLPCFYAAAEDAKHIEGYWQIPDDNGKPESIAAFYKHDDMYFARIVAIYDEDTGKITETLADPKEKAKGISGNPTICGLDFIWNLKPYDDDKHVKGTVIDPDNGNTYVCKVWFDAKKNKIVVRGEWLLFGENEYWSPMKLADVPETARIDFKTIKPVIPSGS